MDGDQIGRLFYLLLLGIAVGGYAIVANRGQFGRMLRHGALWGLIFVGAVAVVGLWSDIRNDMAPRQAVFADQGRVEVPRSPDGHYHLRLDLDGKSVDFIVDTGASAIVLTRKDARRVGIPLDDLIYSGRARTANGVVRTARARVGEIALGPIRDRDVAVWVNEGEMERSLLGMTYLQRFDRLEISDRTLILER